MSECRHQSWTPICVCIRDELISDDHARLNSNECISDDRFSDDLIVDNLPVMNVSVMTISLMTMSVMTIQAMIIPVSGDWSSPRTMPV
jgi:hypothetical protein